MAGRGLTFVRDFFSRKETNKRRDECFCVLFDFGCHLFLRLVFVSVLWNWTFIRTKNKKKTKKLKMCIEKTEEMYAIEHVIVKSFCTNFVFVINFSKMEEKKPLKWSYSNNLFILKHSIYQACIFSPSYLKTIFTKPKILTLRNQITFFRTSHLYFVTFLFLLGSSVFFCSK